VISILSPEMCCLSKMTSAVSLHSIRPKPWRTANRLLPNEQMARVQVLGTPLKAILPICNGIEAIALSRCYESVSLLHQVPCVADRQLHRDDPQQEKGGQWAGQLEGLALLRLRDLKMDLR